VGAFEQARLGANEFIAAVTIVPVIRLTRGAVITVEVAIHSGFTTVQPTYSVVIEH
jgi:hypothetical protein